MNVRLPAAGDDALVLRPVVPADHRELVRIMRTPEVHRWWRTVLPDHELRDLTAVVVDGTLVGALQLWEEEDPDYRVASIDVFLDPAAHGRGIGPAALHAAVRRMAAEHGLHRFTYDPEAANGPSIRAAEKAGFQRVGTLRRHVRLPDGSWADGVLLEALAEDVEALAEPRVQARA